MCISAKDGKNEQLAEELDAAITRKDHQEWSVKYDVQAENSNTKVLAILSMCLISLLIVISGYLLIYNVMYISVAKDIRFYGMLKTIGASSSQIRRLVKKQTAYLAMVGIVIGTLCGTLASFWLVPLAMKTVSGGREAGLISGEIDFNPYIYLFSIAFAVITIYLGVKKPAKIAGKVSPMEALKYQSGSREKVKRYKTSGRGKVFSMAYRNVFRDKKRCRLVFASLFLGTAVFLCINTFINCLDADSYLENYFYHDYVLYASDEVISGVHEDMKSMEEIADEIRELNGIDEVQVNKSATVVLPFDAELYKPFLQSRVGGANQISLEEYSQRYENQTDSELMYSSNMVSVDSSMIELYNKKARQKIDVRKFEEGELCLIGYTDTVEDSEAMLGKNIALRNPSTGMEKVIEIGAAPTSEESYGISCGYYEWLIGSPEVILVSHGFMEELFPEAKVNCIIADAKWRSEPKVTPEITRIEKENPAIGETDIRSTETEDFKESMMSVTIVGDAISGILVLIGLINFINVMLTGVYTRNNELAVLESVGMTKRQIKKMLMLEGLVYGMITVALILTLGSLMIYGTGELCKNLADYANMHYPAALVAVTSVLIIVICTVVPVLVYKEISKKTVTERLRLGEV